MERTNKSGLTPELKAWIDRVIVPALVDEYIQARLLAQDVDLANAASAVAECTAKSSAPAGRSR